MKTLTKVSYLLALLTLPALAADSTTSIRGICEEHADVLKTKNFNIPLLQRKFQNPNCQNAIALYYSAVEKGAQSCQSLFDHTEPSTEDVNPCSGDASSAPGAETEGTRSDVSQVVKQMAASDISESTKTYGNLKAMMMQATGGDPCGGIIEKLASQSKKLSDELKTAPSVAGFYKSQAKQPELTKEMAVENSTRPAPKPPRRGPIRATYIDGKGIRYYIAQVPTRGTYVVARTKVGGTTVTHAYKVSSDASKFKALADNPEEIKATFKKLALSSNAPISIERNSKGNITSKLTAEAASVDKIIRNSSRPASVRKPASLHTNDSGIRYFVINIPNKGQYVVSQVPSGNGTLMTQAFKLPEDGTHYPSLSSDKRQIKSIFKKLKINSTNRPLKFVTDSKGQVDAPLTEEEIAIKDVVFQK